MNIKGIIINFENSQKELEDRIDSLKELFEQEEQLWTNYEMLNSQFFLHEKAINFFADSLRMVNDESRLQRYSLEDIQRIYEILVKYHPNNIQYQEDLISFVYNVMDNEDQTLLLINNATKHINDKRKCFRKILTEIKKNKK